MLSLQPGSLDNKHLILRIRSIVASGGPRLLHNFRELYNFLFVLLESLTRRYYRALVIKSYPVNNFISFSHTTSKWRKILYARSMLTLSVFKWFDDFQLLKYKFKLTRVARPTGLLKFTSGCDFQCTLLFSRNNIFVLLLSYYTLVHMRVCRVCAFLMHLL